MNREKQDNVQETQENTKAGSSSPLWSPVLTRRRLSVPEIIMRKHALTQQRSRSDSNSDNESISALLPLEKKPSPSPRLNRYRNFQLDRASGSDGDLTALRDGRMTGRKRDSVMHMRKSALLRRFWNKELERNQSAEAIYTPHTSGSYLARNWSPTRGRLRHNGSLYNINRETFYSTSDLNENPTSKSFDLNNADILPSRTESNNNVQRSGGFNIHIRTTVNTGCTDSIFTPSLSETYPLDETTNMSSTLESNQNRFVSSDLITDQSSWAENNSLMTTTVTPDYPRSLVTTAKSPLSTDSTENSHVTDSAYSNSNGTPISAEQSSSSPRTVCDSVNNNQTSDYVIKSQSVTPRVSDLNKNNISDIKSEQNHSLNTSNKTTVLNKQIHSSESGTIKNQIKTELLCNTKDSSSQTLNNSNIINNSDNTKAKVNEHSICNSSMDVTGAKRTSQIHSEIKECKGNHCDLENSLETATYNSSLIEYGNSIVDNNMSNVLTGSAYKNVEENSDLLVPRYSAIPRTSSMEVGVSSGDCATEESECGSLVDSLDDPNSPRPPHDFERPLSGRSIKSPKTDKFLSQPENVSVASKNAITNTDFSQFAPSIAYFHNLSSEPIEDTQKLHVNKHDRKLARGEIKPLTPHENGAEKKKSPERKGSAFFVAIEKDKEPKAIEDESIVKQVVVSDHMPKRLKERIQKRQTIIEKHKNVRKKKCHHKHAKNINESVPFDRNGNETYRVLDKTDTKNTKMDNIERNRNRKQDILLKTRISNGKSKRERWMRDVESLETYRIDSHGNMQLINKDNNWEKRAQLQNSNVFKKQSQISRSSMQKKTNSINNCTSNKAIYQNSSKITPNKSLRSVTISEGNAARSFEYANTSSLKFPNDQDLCATQNPMPRRIYQKTEFNDGGRKIEILEIVECVDNRNNRGNDTIIKNKHQVTSTSFKSKIPIPVNTTPKSFHCDPENESVIAYMEPKYEFMQDGNKYLKRKEISVEIPSEEVLERKPLNITKAVYSSIEDIDEDPTIDRLIAGILIGNLHNPESLRSPFHTSRDSQTQPAKPPQIIVKTDPEPAPRHYRSQRFESIPEERSASMDSSTEEHFRYNSVDEDSTNDPDYIDTTTDEIDQRVRPHRMIQTDLVTLPKGSINSATDTTDLVWDGQASADLAKIKFVNYKESQRGSSINVSTEQCTQTGQNGDKKVHEVHRFNEDDPFKEIPEVLSFPSNQLNENKVFRSTATLIFKQKSFVPMMGNESTDVSRLKFEASNELVTPKEHCIDTKEEITICKSVDKETSTNGNMEIETEEKLIDKSIQTFETKINNLDTKTQVDKYTECSKDTQCSKTERISLEKNNQTLNRSMYTQTENSFISSITPVSFIKEPEATELEIEKCTNRETQTSANNSPKQFSPKSKTCANQTDFDVELDSLNNVKIQEHIIFPVEENGVASVPQGWTSFYLLRNTQKPANESCLDTGQYNKLTETTITSKRGKENFRNGKKFIQRKKEKSSSVENLPTLVTNKTSIEETVQLRLLPQGERKKSVVATKSTATNVLQQTSHQGSTYTESSESESCSSDTDKSKVSYPPIITSAKGAKKQKRTSIQKPTVHKSRQKITSTNDSWSVTVTGTSTYHDGGPDLRMRLRFPTSAESAHMHHHQKSDPGVDKEFSLHQALPPADDDIVNEHFSTMRNVSRSLPHQSSNITRDQTMKKKFQYLPDVNKSQNAAKPLKVFRNEMHPVLQRGEHRKASEERIRDQYTTLPSIRFQSRED